MMNNSLLDEVNLDDVLISDCSYLSIDGDNVIQRNMNNSLVIAHLNIHSLPNKYHDLQELLNCMKEKNILPDIVLLCETFLNDRNASRFTFENYTLVSCYRKLKKQGGVSVMVRSHIKFIERQDLNVFHEGRFESIFIEIPRKGKNIIIGEVYRVPGTCEKAFIETYEGIVQKIRLEHKQIIIGTDQNLDYLKINSHRNTQQFFDLNLSNNLIATVYKPTRITQNSATLIDNIYIDVELYKNIKSYIITTDISDHYMCVTLIDNCCISMKHFEEVKFRKMDETALRQIKASLLNRDWGELEELSVDQGSELLINELSRVIDFYAPEKNLRINKNPSKIEEPWFTKGLRKSSQKCYDMYSKQIGKPKTSTEFQNYKKYRNLYNKLRRITKVTYYKSLIKENRNNSKKLWAILNKLTGKINNKKELSDEFIVNGVKEDNVKKISNAFAKHYSEIGELLADKIKEKHTVNDPMSTMRNKVDQNCFFFPTSIKEIEKIIKKLKDKHSKGYDNISNTMLKKIYPSIIKALLIIFNKSLNEGKFPDNMKISIVKPIYKGKCKNEIVNYRPISLLPVISKVLEKIVHIRVVNFLVKNRVIYEGQYGYRSKRSTADAILDLTGNILDNIEKGQFTLAIFLDMSKAFDSISHTTLCKKLEYYGLRGNVKSWFVSYLKDRTIRVKYKNTLSDEHTVNYGTPQGSVLGPLMYILLSNDLPKCLKFSSCVTFADDTTVFISGNNLRFLYKKMNEELKSLSDWFNSNSLTLNVEKTKYILFRSKQKSVNTSGKIELDKKTIPQVKSIKFLGIVLDEYLDCNLQVKHILSKIAAGNYSLSMAKNILPIESKLLLYFSHVQSHLVYAISAWGPLLKKGDLKCIKKQGGRRRARGA